MKSLHDKSWLRINVKPSNDQIEVRVPLSSLSPKIIDLTTPLQLNDYTLSGRKGDSKPIPAIGGLSVAPYPWWPYKVNEYDCFHKERFWNCVYYQHKSTGNRIYLAWNWHYLWLRYNPAIYSTLSHYEVVSVLKSVIDNFSLQYNHWSDKLNKDNFMVIPYQKVCADALYQAAYVKKIEIAIDVNLEDADIDTFFYLMQTKEDLHISWVRKEPTIICKDDKKKVVRDDRCLLPQIPTIYRGSHKSSSKTAEYLYGIETTQSTRKRVGTKNKTPDKQDEGFNSFLASLEKDINDDVEDKYDSNAKNASEAIIADESGLIYRLENRLTVRRLRKLGIRHPEHLSTFNPATLWNRYKFEAPDYDKIILFLKDKYDNDATDTFLQSIRYLSAFEIRKLLKGYTHDPARFMKAKLPEFDKVVVEKLTALRKVYSSEENYQSYIIQCHFLNTPISTTNTTVILSDSNNLNTDITNSSNSITENKSETHTNNQTNTCTSNKNYTVTNSKINTNISITSNINMFILVNNSNSTHIHNNFSNATKTITNNNRYLDNVIDTIFTVKGSATSFIGIYYPDAINVNRLPINAEDSIIEVLIAHFTECTNCKTYALYNAKVESKCRSPGIIV
ncbi:MAG: hypothetical protein HQK96_05855 [Nitrospirae bacterium]|nr:hypothetical protein [Nitrospirota bacterium]MBF0554070.1 hypothetical protein [Nitrospirota bacterium]